MSAIFQRDPFLVIKAYESGIDFQIFIESVKDADPEIALAGIEFWDNFIMLDSVVYQVDFKKKLFEL